MDSRLAVFLSAVSVAAIIGTGINASASADQALDRDSILTRAQWSEIMVFAQECRDRGQDSDQTAAAVATEAEMIIESDPCSAALKPDSIQGIADRLGWLAVQHSDIANTLEELAEEGASTEECRDAVGPMVTYYKSLAERLAEILAAHGLECYVPSN